MGDVANGTLGLLLSRVGVIFYLDALRKLSSNDPSYSLFNFSESCLNLFLNERTAFILDNK